jgi:serine/threonine-protein kinase
MVDIHPGDVLGGAFCVERVLERGGAGLWVSARHTQFEKRVVIRLLPPAPDGRQAARLKREARLLAKIESEYAARILDVATHVDGSLYMVREHVAGSTLAERLDVEGPLPLERAALYLLQMCEVVQEVHRLGVVLRELGTKQVIVTEGRGGDTRIKLVDLGAAKYLDGEATATLGVGISPYTAPELFRTTDVDGRVDVWALGCVFYEMLTGRPPFEGQGASVGRSPSRPTIASAARTRSPMRCATSSRARALCSSSASAASRMVDRRATTKRSRA